MLYNFKEYKSVYEYKDCKVLKNKFDIKDKDEFDRYERVITTAQIAELNQNPIKGNFDLRHLKKIHNHIFKDVYKWSGQLRIEEISKEDTDFAPSRFLSGGMQERIFDPLKKEKYLKGLNAKDISKRLAHYYSELNFAHPFREGNGRTQREFIKELSAKNGFDLDWNKADPKDLMKATISATMGTDMEKGKEKLAELILDSFVEKEPDKLLMKDMKKFFEIGRDR